MTKQERIKTDRKMFKQLGFKSIKFIELFNYYDDYEKAVTIYRVKEGKEYLTQMLFPDKLNPQDIYNSIKEQLEKDLKVNILDHRFEFQESGLIYNILCEDEHKLEQEFIFVKYNPLTCEVTYTEIGEGVGDGK